MNALDRPFVAQYWGTCGVCHESIKPGQMARYGPGTIGVVHDDCDNPDGEPPERPVTVCPICHLTQPCEHSE